MSNQYAQRGVSAGKEDVHFAIKQLDKGLYPNAFCRILPDLSANDPDWCTLMHADGTGTKSSLAYIYWRETGDISVWRDLAQDALVMNTDDMVCAGSLGPFLFSNTIGRNKFRIPREVLGEILAGMEAFFESMRPFGIQAVNTGGETADVGDLVRTLVLDATAFARMPRREVIPNTEIKDGSVIVGLGSSGQTTYENSYNSGIGSNGLTNGRHDVLASLYREKYPESYDPQVDPSLIYAGKHQLTDVHPGLNIPIGKLLLSPTRTYMPVMQQVLSQYREKIHGLIHCTGGGQTKIMKFVNGLQVIKDNLFEVPPIFQLIQETSTTDWREMYQVFNMGHRLEVYTDEHTAKHVIDIAAKFELEAKVVGHCEKSEQNELRLHGPSGVITY
ncbi:MAG: AIR synthase-related protein [Bacteroidota bacterium]